MPSARPTPLIIATTSISLLLLVLLATQAHSHGHHYHHHHHGHHHRHHRQSREFVDAHNQARQLYNLPLLTWDRNLARYARRWASKRVVDCKMIHSYGPYGENIFWGGRDHWTASEAVVSWVRENQFYDPETNQCAQGEMCGHYTQVVWKSSLRVGCTRMKCLNGGVLVFCEYDPPGNYVNENPFGKIFDDLIDPQQPPVPATSSDPLAERFT